jgi:hypothetical protein
MDREAAPMPEATVAADLHESFDVEVDFAPEVAFNGEMTVNIFPDTGDFFFGQVTDPRFGFDANRVGHFSSTSTANAVDIRQRDLNLFVVWDINTSDARQPVSLLALTLLVAGVLADHAHDAIAPNDLALVAAPLYGSTNFHNPTQPIRFAVKDKYCPGQATAVAGRKGQRADRNLIIFLSAGARLRARPA